MLKIAQSEKAARKVLERTEKKGRKCFIEPAERWFVDLVEGKR